MKKKNEEMGGEGEKDNDTKTKEKVMGGSLLGELCLQLLKILLLLLLGGHLLLGQCNHSLLEAVEDGLVVLGREDEATNLNQTS